MRSIYHFLFFVISFLAVLEAISATGDIPRTEEEAKKELASYHFSKDEIKRAHFEKILDYYPALVQHVWQKNYTSDSPEIIDVLLKRGADINARVPHYGENWSSTPLITLMSYMNEPYEVRFHGCWEPGPEPKALMRFNRFLEEWTDFEIKDSWGRTVEEIATNCLNNYPSDFDTIEHHKHKWLTTLSALRDRREKQEIIPIIFAGILGKICGFDEQAIGSLVVGYFDHRDKAILFRGVPLANQGEIALAFKRRIEMPARLSAPSLLLPMVGQQQEKSRREKKCSGCVIN